MAYTTINDPTQYFNTVLYTGNNVDDRSITGVGFQPDFMWSKERNSTGNHFLVDSSRGATKVLQGNLSNPEANVTDGFQAFESDGFQVGAANSTNETGVNYVNWCWLANGGTTSSNTDGTVTSTVQANTTAGFSIVQWTGIHPGNHTVGHGLGKRPECIIVKTRDSDENWIVRFKDTITGNAFHKLHLNKNNTIAVDYTLGNMQDTTSSVFYLQNSDQENNNGDAMIAYCFAPIKGFSKFGSYTGNGSTDGPFNYLGFKPAFLIWKNTNGVDGWYMYDNKRSPYNQIREYLSPNQNIVEGTNGGAVDFVSNGWKIRNTGTDMNTSGSTYIYMAFAESPFVSSDGVPTTAG